MTKLEKFLAKLTQKERVVAKHLIEKIENLDLDGLDVKKLTDMDGLYRVRKGDIRIKFYIVGKNANIMEFDRKDDTTYG